MSETPTTAASGPNQTSIKIYGDQRVKAMVEAISAGLGCSQSAAGREAIKQLFDECFPDLDPKQVKQGCNSEANLCTLAHGLPIDASTQAKPEVHANEDTTSSGVTDHHSDTEKFQSTSENCSQQPYRDPNHLREIYEQEETITGTAAHFDIAPMTARTWLIHHDIFDPDTDGLSMPHERLKELDPEDVDINGGGDQ